MGEKKMPGRFTLQFNMDDPQQREVAQFLDRQGRRKTQFITNAVLHYLRYGANTDVPGASLMNATDVLNILAKIVSHSLAPQSQLTETMEAQQEHDRGTSLSGEFMMDDDQGTDYSAIANTLLAFDNQ